METVFVVLGTIVFGGLCVGVSVLISAIRGKKTKQALPKKLLVHSINDDRCTGCEACITVCPTDVLALVSNKSRVERFGDCIQCEQCVTACPTCTSACRQRRGHRGREKRTASTITSSALRRFSV